MLEQGSPALSAREFEERLLRFINEVLPGLNRSPKPWVPVAADTPLFATGLLDSLSILHLIWVVEELIGRPVPDEMVVMKHCQSVASITASFWPTQP